MTDYKSQCLALRPDAFIRHYQGGVGYCWVCLPTTPGKGRAVHLASCPTEEEAWADALLVFQAELWQHALTL